MNGFGVVLAAVVVLVSPSLARAQGFDRLGVPFNRTADLMESPDASTAPGLFWRARVAEPIVAADIHEHELYAHWVGASLGTALKLQRQGSVIHARTTVGLALQVRSAIGVCGIAAAVEQWSFDAGASRQRPRLKLAWGRTFTKRATLGLQLRPPLATDDRLAIDILLGTSHFAPFHLVFREQRVAGFQVARQFGVIWGRTNLSLHAGYNGVTMATSVGIALSTGRWSWDASGTVHPYLGHGRQWGLSLQL